MTGSPEPSAGIVHLVEDDDSVRVGTARFLRANGYDVRMYASAEEFLAAATRDEENACLVLDVKLPGSSGLELQQLLPDGGAPLPIVFLTGQSEISDAVRAMKAGAVDFLTKTADGEELIDAVRKALVRCADDRVARARRSEAEARYRRLTPREREVFAHLISGQLNKQVGYDLHISERTVKIHRHHVLEKMEADSIADLVRIASDLGISPEGTVR